MLRGPRHRGLATMRTLFTCSLSWEYKREQRPYGTQSLANTNSVPDQQSLYPDGQHTLAFYIKCVPAMGELLLLVPLRRANPDP